MPRSFAICLLLVACTKPQGTINLQSQCQTREDCDPGFTCQESRCVKSSSETPQATPTQPEPPPVVVPPVELADFSISLDTSDLTLGTNEVKTLTVNLTRIKAAAGDAVFFVSGLPGTVGWSLPTTIADSSTLQLSASTGPAAGVFDIVVTATIAGVEKSAIFKLHLKKTVRLTFARPTTDPVANVRVLLNGVWRNTDANGQVTDTLTTQNYSIVVLIKEQFFQMTSYNAHMIADLSEPTLTIGLAKPFGAIAAYMLTTNSCTSPITSPDAAWNVMVSSRGTYESGKMTSHGCDMTMTYGDATAPVEHVGRKYALEFKSPSSFAFGYTDVTFSDPQTAPFDVGVIAMTMLPAGDVISGTATATVPSAEFTNLAFSSNAVLVERTELQTQFANALTLPFVSLNNGMFKTVLSMSAYDPTSSKRSTRYVPVTQSGPVSVTLVAPATLSAPAPFAPNLDETSTFSWTPVPGTVSRLSVSTNSANNKTYTFTCYTVGSSCALPDLTLDATASEWAMPTNAPGNWQVQSVNAPSVGSLYGPLGTTVGGILRQAVTEDTILTVSELRPFN